MTAAIRIEDSLSGSSAEIAPGLGFNCFKFTVQSAGRPIDILYSHPNFAAGTKRPSGSGIPILFPFPGRIAGTEFEWEGKKYQLEPGDALGNAIHGFVLRRAWRVIDQGQAHVTGEFHAWRDDPDLKQRWPADFRIQATYRLAGNTLQSTYRLENPGEQPLPFGFGTHPYFRLPVGGKSVDDCIVRLPVSARWELENMLPTGRQIDLPDAAMAAGLPFGQLKLDDVFTGLHATEQWITTSIYDPRGQTVTQRFSREFRECVVYTPPHREAICIEPYTCVPGAWELHKRGVDVGLRTLAPGEQLELAVEIEVT